MLLIAVWETWPAAVTILQYHTVSSITHCAQEDGGDRSGETTFDHIPTRERWSIHFEGAPQVHDIMLPCARDDVGL